MRLLYVTLKPALSSNVAVMTIGSSVSVGVKPLIVYVRTPVDSVYVCDGVPFALLNENRFPEVGNLYCPNAFAYTVTEPLPPS